MEALLRRRHGHRRRLRNVASRLRTRGAGMREGSSDQAGPPCTRSGGTLRSVPVCNLPLFALYGLFSSLFVPFS